MTEMTRETKSSYSLSDNTIKIFLFAVLASLTLFVCEASWQVSSIGKTADPRYKSEIAIIDPLANSWLPQVQNGDTIDLFVKNFPTSFVSSADYTEKGKLSPNESIRKILDEKLVVRDLKSKTSLFIVHIDQEFPRETLIPLLKIARERYYDILISTYHANMEKSAKANQEFDYNTISEIETNYVLYKDKFFKEPITTIITASPRFDYYKYAAILIGIFAAFLYFTPYQYLKNSFNFTRSLLFGNQTVEQN